LEDVVGLDLREVEDLHEARAGLRRVIARADELDDLVDVEDRDEQAVHEVQALLATRETVLAATRHDLDAVVEVDLQQLLEAERLRAPLDERDVVDRESVLERRQP